MSDEITTIELDLTFDQFEALRIALQRYSEFIDQHRRKETNKIRKKKLINRADMVDQLSDEIAALYKAEQSNELPGWLVEQYEDRAAAEREAGTTIEINDLIPYVAIEYSNGESYYFQGDEAETLLKEVPDNIHAEDYILAMSQNW